ASFRKYLKEKFTTKVNLKAAYFVDGTDENRKALGEKINESPIDIGLIGIGENGHIAFNDPPADFETEEPYIVVKLNDTCKKQQVGEGWFATPDDVPTHAVSMSVKQIMKCKKIISCVPYAVKADAVYKTISGELSNLVPATMLKTHPDFTLYIDHDSAAKLSVPVLWDVK
ncbi:MAG: 6-phosphogluconolactonase, partial [Clostridia bacterium]|nr:6-phosphogluconolactonase [Clostridia bacterium]